MTPELYLIAPPDADAERLAASLPQLLEAAPIAALLLRRGERSLGDYEALVRRVAPLAQEAGTAVLIEGEPKLAVALGVDGLHVEGSAADLKAAMGALKPDLIVGAGGIGSRHEAMSKGELGPDYIMFGPFSGAMAPETRELAGWWSEAIEIPSVLSDPEATPETADAAGCEFLALGESVFEAADPADRVASIAAALEARG